MEYHRRNFHEATYAVFTRVEPQNGPSRNPDFTSRSGSRYWFDDQGVTRESNHWGRAARCKWKLESNATPARGRATGFARWQDFHRDNDQEKLYFITYDPASRKVAYEHRDRTPHGSAVLRTSAETIARIRQIRQLLQQDQWMKYYAIDPETLRAQVIHQLIETDQTLPEIKRTLT